MGAEIYTQSRLQDYIDCPYRYWLRYIQQLDSPSVQAEPVREHELAVDRGTEFHRLAQQYIAGVPADTLANRIDDERVKQWWSEFQRTAFGDLPTRRYSEITLIAPLDGATLSAKIDFLAVEPGRIVIVDWKTSRKPSIDVLINRVQTKVYRWVVSQAVSGFLDGTIKPKDIEMRYWFAGHRTPVVVISYSQELQSADERELMSLIRKIRHDREFARTTDLNMCRVCAYRSLSRPEQPPSEASLVDDDVYRREHQVVDDQ